jgi:hypothetical protein
VEAVREVERQRRHHDDDQKEQLNIHVCGVSILTRCANRTKKKSAGCGRVVGKCLPSVCWYLSAVPKPMNIGRRPVRRIHLCRPGGRVTRSPQIRFPQSCGLFPASADRPARRQRPHRRDLPRRVRTPAGLPRSPRTRTRQQRLHPRRPPGADSLVHALRRRRGPGLPANHRAVLAIPAKTLRPARARVPVPRSDRPILATPDRRSWSGAAQRGAARHRP